MVLVLTMSLTIAIVIAMPMDLVHQIDRAAVHLAAYFVGSRMFVAQVVAAVVRG